MLRRRFFAALAAVVPVGFASQIKASPETESLIPLHMESDLKALRMLWPMEHGELGQRTFWAMETLIGLFVTRQTGRALAPNEMPRVLVHAPGSCSYGCVDPLEQRATIGFKAHVSKEEWGDFVRISGEQYDALTRDEDFQYRVSAIFGEELARVHKCRESGEMPKYDTTFTTPPGHPFFLLDGSRDLSGWHCHRS